MGCNIVEDENYILCYVGQTLLSVLCSKDYMDRWISDKEDVFLIRNPSNYKKFYSYIGNSRLRWKIQTYQLYKATKKSQEKEIISFYSDMRKGHLLADDRVDGDWN